MPIQLQLSLIILSFLDLAPPNSVKSALNLGREDPLH